ncbi:unnamed protein product [Anisakis simplex]|uniref:Fork-head domain-containing protein n=1 Tax=Anisakis simplex TaxID=6269 RepID=A0A0M3K0Z7_ANISI|nr:unnamed protein product [Anisakis simplex]
MPPTSNEQLDTSINEEMDRLGTLTLSDYGIRNQDVHYLYVDSVLSGRGPDRLKFLEIEGKWKLSNRSTPYINAAFKHLERLNDAKGALRQVFTDEPLNAIGMMGWTPSPPVPNKHRKSQVTVQPDAEFKEQLAPSPRQPVPHRSAGYGNLSTATSELLHRTTFEVLFESARRAAEVSKRNLGPAHQKRKLNVSEHTTNSPPESGETPILITDYDKYAKYLTKDSSLKSSAKGDLGYSSSEERNSLESPSPKSDKIAAIVPNSDDEKVHQQKSQSPKLSSSARRRSKLNSSTIARYEPTYVNRDRHYGDDLTISVKETTKQLPYRSGGYGSPHLHRQYDLSPRSVEYSSEPEQPSPPHSRNIDDILVTTYHMTKTTRRERAPPNASSTAR